MKPSLLGLCVLVAACGDRSAGNPEPVQPAATALSGTPPPSATQPPPLPSQSASLPASEPGCLPQPPQDFLVRSHYNTSGPLTPEKRTAWKTALEAAHRYRTQQYGYFPGFGSRSDNPKTAVSQTKLTTFFGISVVLNERIIPALACVEAALRRDCAKDDYRPLILSGLRRKNTYLSGEVSNHVYGIALDIDPARNPCCNCLRPWRDSPRCQGKKRTVWERMDMPRCWVEVFERYGFYWLGHDELEDSMHFEFLGDPSRIMGVPTEQQPEGQPATLHSTSQLR